MRTTWSAFQKTSQQIFDNATLLADTLILHVIGPWIMSCWQLSFPRYIRVFAPPPRQNPSLIRVRRVLWLCVCNAEDYETNNHAFTVKVECLEIRSARLFKYYRSLGPQTMPWLYVVPQPTAYYSRRPRDVTSSQYVGFQQPERGHGQC